LFEDVEFAEITSKYFKFKEDIESGKHVKLHNFILCTWILLTTI